LRPGEWSGGRFGRRLSREFGGRERPPLHRRRRLIVLADVKNPERMLDVLLPGF